MSRHNIVLASFSWLAWDRGPNLFDSTVGQVFWRDFSGEGVIVARVKQGSSLQKSLKPGDVMLQIDNFSLRARKLSNPHHRKAIASTERWHEYFLTRNPADKQPQIQGWCFSNPKWETFSTDCCEISYSRIELEGPPTLCFKTKKLVHERDQSRCLSTSEILNLEQNRRCSNNVDCPEGNGCIEAALGRNLAGVQTLAHGTGAKRNLSYCDAAKLWEEVRVTHLMPRYGFINAGVILTVHEWLGFLVSLSLGLAFMNLLPLRSFDGSVICEALISFASISPLDDLEDLIAGTTTELDSIGHAKPIFSFDQTIGTSKEIERSLLYGFLSCLVYILEKLSSLGKNFTGATRLDYTTGQKSMSYSKTLHRRKTYFCTFQKVTTWICCFVFLGLLTLEFQTSMS